jgi:hypothetical protein
MVNQPHKFKDRDIQRVVRAARRAGIDVARVEVNPRTGEIAAVARQPGEPPKDNGAGIINPWDEVLTNDPDQERPA